MKIDRDKHRITVDDIEYLAGTAGSIILGCDHCGGERFRDPYHFFVNPGHRTLETCFGCTPGRAMLPIKISELETKWRPLWNRIDKVL